MRHLSSFFSPLSKQKIADLTFHFDPEHKADLTNLVRDFLGRPEDHKALDIPEATRGVFLLEGERKWVIKRNRFVHWKKKIRNYLGVKKSFGLHDLTNEFVNLSTVYRKSNIVPSIAGFGYKALFPFMQEEYLIVEYYEDHKTVDEVLKADPQCAEYLLPLVFSLFGKMLQDGFVHLDPHPKNILVGPDGCLRLIDFECCSNSVIDHDFSLGFLMGYFYHFWICRYVTLESYRAGCERYLSSEMPNIDRLVFQPVFEKFIFRKVSRTTRYSILTSAREQEKFKKKIAENNPDSVYGVRTN